MPWRDFRRSLRAVAGGQLPRRPSPGGSNMEFNLSPDVHVGKDQQGKVRQLRHTHKPYTVDQAGLAATGAPVTPRALAEQYLRDVAGIYELAPTATANFAAALAPSPTNDAAQLRFKEEKSVQNSTTVSYAQTLYGL